jgi:hypothetical protein
MSASFVATPDIVRDFREQSEMLEITDDFTSFLGDIALGIETQELEARLRMRDGYARRSNGDYYQTRQGDYVSETREVQPEAAAIVRAEQKFSSSIKTRAREASDFLSFTTEVIGFSTDSRADLQARLRARDGYARRSNGDYYQTSQGDYIRENRQVRPEQASSLVDCFDLVAEATTNDRRLINLSSFYVDVDRFGAEQDEIQELQARLRARDGYARTSNGDYYQTRRGNYIRESRTTEDQDARLLIKDAIAVRDVALSAERAQYTVSYLADIADGQIANTQELNARLRNRDGYALRADGDYYLSNQGNLVRETRSISDEQAVQVRRFYSQLGECGEYGTALAAELRQGGDGQNTLQRVELAYAQAMTMGDAQLLESRRDMLQELSRIWRRTKADSFITGEIVRTDGDVNEVFRLIRDDPEEDLVDRRRAEELTALCYARRRVAFSSNIIEALSAPAADIDDLLQRISDFGTSPSPDDRERALELTRYVYQAEVLRDQQDLAETLVTTTDDPDVYANLLGNIKLRPGVDGYNYGEAIQKRTERFRSLEEVATQVGIDREVQYAAGCFNRSTPASILDLIADIANRDQGQETAEALLEFYKLYLTNRRDERREDYQEVFSAEVEALRKTLGLEYNFNQELGTNLAAAKKLAERFSTVVLPLFQSLRGEPGFQSLVAGFMAGDEPGDREPRNRFTLDVDRLAAQRDLSENEVAYLKSVQALSAFNPYLVAIANANPGLAFAYLESHFKEQSASTYEKLIGSNTDIPYVPLLQVGLGPNGLASLGEIMRSRPELMDDMLVVDDLELPSGPFGIPKGEAWDLNSANSSGFDGIRLPDPAPAELEGKRVRDYGSPTRWFPGERNDDRDTRPGSINTTVDYLPTPDVISNGRYPNNEDLSLVLQLQTAMLADNLLLKTKLLGVEEMQPGALGKYRAYLETYNTQGEQVITSVYTDGVITSSGLGERSFGFELEGSRAKEVLDLQPETGFPKLSTTLDAFKALANKESQPPIPGETIVIYGTGNSADTLVEYLGGLFSSGNPVIRNIRKIYVVGDGKLSKRPRYAQISDLRARNGRESLVEIVEARVGDVAYTDPANADVSKLRLIDSNGNIITDARGRELQGDHVVAATGFRPQLARIFAGTGAVQQTPAGPRLDTKPVVLPTNPNVVVAETVDSKKELLLIGTASNSGFNVTDKLLQLPRLAREALLRNGAENAVAIGFRAPDTQAAVRLYLGNNSEIGARPADAEAGKAKRIIVDASRVVADKTEVDLGDLTPAAGLPALRRDIASGSETLTPLLLRHLAPVKLAGRGQNHEYKLCLDMNGTTKLTTDGEVPVELLKLVGEGAADPYFQAYARNALRLRRGSNGIDVVLRFNNGRLQFKESYAQAA